MNKKLITLFLISLSGMMVSCSKSGQLDVAPDTDHEEADISLSTELPDLQELAKTETRVSLVPKKDADGKADGVSIVWEKGEKVRVFSYITQGARSAVVESEMTIDLDENGKFIGKYDIKLPANSGIDLGAPNVLVAGAIGVTGINSKGRATVNTRKEIDKSFVPPMYFPLMKLTPNGKNKSGKNQYRLRPHFTFYGSILNVVIESQLYDPFTPRDIHFRTDVFSSNGDMDLASTQGGNYPKWVGHDAKYPKRYKINLGTVYRKVNGKSQHLKTFSLWVKPNDQFKDPNAQFKDKKLKVYVRDYAYRFQPEQREEAVSLEIGVKKPLREQKVYDLNVKITSDLIFTEVYTGGTGSSSGFIEIYNPTMQNIKLSDYYIINRDYNEGPEKNFSIPLGKDFKHGIYGVWKDDSDLSHISSRAKSVHGEYVLEPGKTLVLTSTAIHRSVHLQRSDLCPESIQYLYRFSGGTTLSIPGRKDENPYALKLHGKRFIAIAKSPNNDADIVDALFRFNTTDVEGSFYSHNSFSYARKPNRNFPRPFWYPTERGENSDFVYRTLERGDAGWRFGWYNDGSKKFKYKYGYLPGLKWVYLKEGHVSNDPYPIPAEWDATWAH